MKSKIYYDNNIHDDIKDQINARYGKYGTYCDTDILKYCNNDVFEMTELYTRMAKSYADAYRKSLNDISLAMICTPKKVYFNDPLTVVIWEDGTKTFVKNNDGGPFDHEKALAMAISKKVFGNKYSYYKIFKKWIPNNDNKTQTRQISPKDCLKDE